MGVVSQDQFIDAGHPAGGGRTPPPTVQNQPPRGLAAVVSDAEGTLKGILDLGVGISKHSIRGDLPDFILEQGKAMVDAPWRALKGEAQPGQPPESAPTGLARPVDALSLIIGGDPGTARMREKSGDTIGQISALATGPLLLHGISSALERRTTPPPVGPKPLSAVPELRKNMPEGISRTAETTMRTLGPGKFLPAETERVKKLVSAIGNGDKSIPENLKAVLPELDKTAREYGLHPKGIVGTERITERAGEGVNPTDTLNNLMEHTMSRVEKDFQGILQDISTDSSGNPVLVDATPIADAIHAEITDGIRERAAIDPKSKEAQLLDHLTKQEQAFRGKSLSLQAADDLRKYYRNSSKSYYSKSGESVRQDLRSDGERITDGKIEKSLRDIVYDTAEAESVRRGNQPGYIRHIKDTQRRLYELLDISVPNSVMEFNKDAAVRGYDWLQKQNVTAAVHPSTMTAVGSIHGLKEGIVGKPTDMESVNRRVTQAFGEKGVPNTRGERATANVSSAAKGLARQAAIGSIPERQKQNDTTSSFVKMRAPDGNVSYVPSWKVDHFKTLGAQVVQ